MAANDVPTITTMDDLNHNCLSAILSQINVKERIKFRKVSKKFCKAVDACWGQVKEVKVSYYVPSKESDQNSNDDSSEWRSEKLSGTRHYVGITTCGQKMVEEVLKRCGDNIQTLRDGRYGGSTNSVLPFAIKHCPEIESLSTTVNTEEDDKNLSQLLVSIRKLKYLDLIINFRGANLCFGKIPTDNLETLFFSTWSFSYLPDELRSCQKEVLGRCSLLKHFGGDYYDDELMEFIGQNIELKSLEIESFQCDGITETGLNHILKLKNLTILTLSTVRVPSTGAIPPKLPFTDDFFMALKDNLPLLECLEIEKPRNVTDKGFKSLESLKKLRTLAMTYCDGITDEFLVLFSGLEELDVQGCEIYDEGVIELLKKAETMRRLDLRCTKITNKTLEAAVDVTMKRTNGIRLVLFAIETDSSRRDFNKASPLLHII